jgi:hypothetical protein
MESGVFDNLEVVGIPGFSCRKGSSLEFTRRPTLDVAKVNLYSRRVPESGAAFVIFSTLPDNFTLDNGFAR